MIAAAVMICNEAPDILEWLSYHHVMGVRHFIVYDNESIDETVSVLERVRQHYDIDLVKWPSFPGRVTQIFAYRDACFRLRSRTDIEWCVFVDADEFVASTTGAKLTQLIDRCHKASSICLNWSIFGSSGHRERPSGLVIETFQHRAPLTDACNRVIKSIVRPRDVLDCFNPHYFKVTGDTVDADGNSLLVNERHNGILGDVKLCSWRVNHYATRSRWHWERRLRRGQAGNIPVDEARWLAWDRNDEQDISATHYQASAVHEALDRCALELC